MNKNNTLYFSKILLTSLMLIYLSINAIAINSGAPVNDEHTKNRVNNVVENSKLQTKKERKQGKFTKRIEAFVQEIQTEGSEKEKILVAAKISKILGLLAIPTIFFGVGLLFAIAAIIFGKIALNKIEKSDRKLKGRKQAKAGITFGIISIIFGILFLIWALDAISKSQ